MENVNNTGKIIAGVLVGIAVGGILGILFAPDKGSETRKKILAKDEELTDAIKEKFDDFLKEVKKDVEAVKAKATEFAFDGRAKS